MKLFRKTNNREHLNSYIESKKQFKKTCRQKKKDYQQQLNDKLRNAIKDSKSFWMIINSLGKKTKAENSIQITEFFNHFNKLLNITHSNLLNFEENTSSDETQNIFSNNPEFTFNEIQIALRNLPNE